MILSILLYFNQILHGLTSKLYFTVPLVTLFTKFDAQIIQEYAKLADLEVHKDNWEQARENAEKFYHEVYVSKVQNTKYPPKGYVALEGGNTVLNELISWFNTKIILLNRYGPARDKLS